MWPLAVLTGDRINGFFIRKCMYRRFAGLKKSGRDNEMTLLAQ